MTSGFALQLFPFICMLDFDFGRKGATNGIKRKPTEKILVAEHDQRNQNNARGEGAFNRIDWRRL